MPKNRVLKIQILSIRTVNPFVITKGIRKLNFLNENVFEDDFGEEGFYIF